MKPISAFFALFFIASLSLTCPITQAGTVPFPTDGDLFIGFHGTAPNEYLVDLGQYTQFDNKAVGFHLDLGNYSADLAAVFGSGWATDPNVQWGVAGTFDSISTVFGTKAESSVGVFALPWARQSTSSQNFTGSTIDTMTFGDYAGQTATTNNPSGVIHPTTGLSWASFNNGANSPGGSFNTWVPTIEAPIFPGGNGIVTTRLDLFRMDPDNTGTNPPGKYLGSFDIDSAGNVSFDVFAPLPTVTLTVTDSQAAENPPDNGSFAIARGVATSTPLTVFYTITGTAKNGQDYTRLRGQAVIAARRTSATVTVVPIDDTTRERDETVILTLSPNSTYTVGSPNQGTVTIHSNE